MKTKKIRKLLACATALAMAAQLAFVIPAGAAEGDKTPVYSGTPTWTVLGGDRATVTNYFGLDTTQSAEAEAHIQGGGSGDRRAYTYFTDVTPTNTQNVEVEFYLNISGANTNASHFYLMSDSNKANANPTSGYLVDIEYSSYLKSITINGTAVDNITTSTASAYQPTTETRYAATGLLKYNVLLNYGSKQADVTVYGTTTKTYTVAFADTSATGFKGFYSEVGRALAGCAIYDVNVNTVEKAASTYYTVQFDVNGEASSESVISGGTVASVPETDKTGYIFNGWAKDGDTSSLMTSEEVKALSITADTTFTAVYTKDENYIEPVASVTFGDFPAGGKLVAGSGQGETASNPISVKVTGELGTDLLANPDSRVNDLDVKYELKGFRWVASKNEASTDPEGSTTYCDGYGSFIVDDTAHTADFQITNHPFNYYGQIIATVTYNGTVNTVSAPLVYLGDTTKKSSNDILPRGGYITDFNSYSPDMVGYQTTISSDNRSATDIVTDNWAAYGGNLGRSLSIAEENGSKFMKLKATGTNSSCFAANQIESVTDTQVIFDQMVRFYQNSSVILKSINPVTWTTGVATSFSIDFTGTEISINGNKIADAATGAWYRLVAASDVTSKKCFAILYDTNGTELGRSETVDFSDAGSVTPSYYMYRTPDNANGELDFNDVKIYRAAMDQSTFTSTQSAQTIAIPEDDTTSTATLTVSAKTTEGYDMIGAAAWSVENEPAGVTVTPSETDSHAATVTVDKTASAGTITINATLGGITTPIELLLTSSQDSIKFTSAPTSVSIPMDSTDNVVKYSAAVIDGDGNTIEGKEVTLALYDQNNANPIAPQGISFVDGVMTITSQAKPVTVYVRATGTNSNNETITNAVKVVIHGLAFDFGAGTDEDLADGYTAVTPSTSYSESRGYGIEGTAAAGGEASLTDADTDYLSGTYTFKAKVTSNKLYNVTINYMGTLASEYVSEDLSGVSLSNDAVSTVQYTIPVFDGVLDLALSGEDAKIASIVIEQVEDKTPGTKPNIYTVGDSTIANNGSWAYVLNRDQANYPELTELATFSNNGRGGKNLMTYYTGGEFRDRVLNNVRPDDYVMIGDMGTNGMGATFEEDLNYYIDACLALGAKVILNSYSPHMAVGNYAGCYDSTTHTFNGWRQDSYDNIVRSVYEERKGELAGFVEIGKNADASFTSYVADYAANGYDSADAAAQAIIACAGDKGKDPDHNHYGNGEIACRLMLDGYGTTEGIVAQLVNILSQPKELTVSQPIVSNGTAVVSVSNMTDSDAEVTLAAAVYENDVLKTLKLDAATVAAGESAELTVAAPVGAKLMVWDSMGSMIPYYESVTVE
ncbi:MAG: InlB B-repeat-containing protein [Clostridiales bacterium]|nr:InlB B-repeat-containing protein [Clostridiales bacterium]